MEWINYKEHTHTQKNTFCFAYSVVSGWLIAYVFGKDKIF